MTAEPVKCVTEVQETDLARAQALVAIYDTAWYASLVADGVRAASVYFATGKTYVSFDPDLVDLDVLMGEDGLVIAATLEVAADRMESDGKTAILAGWDGEVLV